MEHMWISDKTNFNSFQPSGIDFYVVYTIYFILLIYLVDKSLQLTIIHSWPHLFTPGIYHAFWVIGAFQMSRVIMFHTFFPTFRLHT